MKIIQIKGIYSGIGKIVFDSMKTIEWTELTNKSLPELPLGSNVELTISFDENDFLFGRDGIVWATYDLRQAEIIQSTLLAQHINSEVKNFDSSADDIFLLKIINETDTNDALDFIWRSSGGLRLKPDWNYPEGEPNKSFELWLTGQ